MTTINRDKIRADALAAAEVKIAHEERKAATMETIAQRCAGMNIPEPMVFDSCGKTFLSFKEITPDALLLLLEIFPPLEMEYRRSPSRRESSFTLATVPVKGEDTEQTPIDAFTITAQRYAHDMGKFCAKWSTVGLEIWADLIEHPLRYSARVSYYPGSHVISTVEACEVHGQPATVRTLRYAAGARDSFSTIMLYSTGGDMRAMVQAWSDKLTAEGRATLAAYESAKRLAQLQPVTPESVADFFPYMKRERETYAAKAGGLRAGTLEQTLALECPQAIAERALAEKHWRSFCKDHGIESRQGYFDHYAWAISFLTRAGLYRVPITDAMRASVTGSFKDDATEYKYGERWL